jgi:hypothetical protein
VTVKESLRDYYLAFVRGVQVVKRMLVKKQHPSANETKPKRKKETDMPGHYGGGMMKKTKKAKKQAATAMAMKKAKKKPKKKM